MRWLPAQPVQRALNLPRTGIDRRQTASHRIARIIMGMDRDVLAGNAAGDDSARDLANLMGQRATIGVAQHDPTRARGIGRLQAIQSVSGVCLIAIKEMFGIKQGFAPLGHKMGKAVANAGHVFVQRDAQRSFDMKVMGFADQTHGRRVRIQHSGQHIIIFGAAPGAFCHTEGRERGTGLRPRVEKGAVGRVRTGPAAFDIVEAKRIQRLRDLYFVLSRELDALGLLPIAERGVEEGERFAGHEAHSSQAIFRAEGPDCPRPPPRVPGAIPGTRFRRFVISAPPV